MNKLAAKQKKQHEARLRGEALVTVKKSAQEVNVPAFLRRKRLRESGITSVEQYIQNKHAMEQAASDSVKTETMSPPKVIVDTDLLTKNTSTGLSSDRLFEQLKAAMETDVQRLSTIKQMDEKSALKRELLPVYETFVSDYMANGEDYPNSVAVVVMIWLFDIGDIEKAVTLGLYLAKTPKQVMPERFNSDLVTFICDYTYDWANAQVKTGHSASPYLGQVIDALQADKWSLPPMVESKLYSMMGKDLFNKKDYLAVIKWCEAAEQANPKGHGTKTLKGNAAKAIEQSKTE